MRSPWAALGQARTVEQLCQAWLAVLWRSLLQAESGLRLLAQDDGAIAPVAIHPAERELSHRRAAATQALRSRDAATTCDDWGHVCLAYPLAVGEVLQGAVVLELGRVPEVDRALRLVHCSSGWMVQLETIALGVAPALALQREAPAPAAPPAHGPPVRTGSASSWRHPLKSWSLLKSWGGSPCAGAGT